jgi:hypothetical protein
MLQLPYEPLQSPYRQGDSSLGREEDGTVDVIREELLKREALRVQNDTHYCGGRLSKKSCVVPPLHNPTPAPSPASTGLLIFLSQSRPLVSPPWKSPGWLAR